MKKITLSFVLIFGIYTSVFAQIDAVRNVVQQRQLYFSDSIAASTYNFAKLSPLLLHKLMPSQSSIISLGHQLEKGKFIPAQGSTQTNTAFLASEGITEISGVRLYGSFLFYKVFEDSTRFAHQTRNNTTTPYYYGSPANNHYERSIYDFDVLGAKNLFNDKLTIGLGLNYHIADHFSNNDPRGSISEYKLETKAALGYNFTRQIKLGIGYVLGYGQEKVNVGYKNKTYFEGLTQPLYVNYLINGYGEPIPKVAKRNYNNLIDRAGLEVTLQLSDTKLGSFYLIGNRIKEEQVYDYRTGEEMTALANYSLTTSTLNLLWVKTIFQGKLSAKVYYENLDGEDFNINFLAKNYVYTGNKSMLNLNYATAKDKNIFNYSVGIEQFSETKLDGITGNKVYYKTAHLNAGFGFNHQLANQKSIGLSVAANYSPSLDSEFAVSEANESYFTKYVIFHDYLYNTAGRYGGSFNANYSFPFFNTMQAALAFNCAYTRNGGMKDLQRDLLSIPGSDRLYTNISLNLYF